MKKRIFISILVIAIVIALVFPFKNYATNSFFEVKETEVLKGEDVELIVNLSKIDYDKFKFELVTDTSVLNISTEDNIEVEKDEESNEISFEIDKSKTSLSKITFSYKVSEDAKAGDIITFLATVTNLENEDESLTEKIEIKIVEKKEISNSVNETQNSISANTVQNSTDLENVIGNPEFGNSAENSQNSSLENNEQNMEGLADMSNLEFSQESSDFAVATETSSSASFNSNSETISNESIAETEEITYNGSGNNYLSSLEISEYSLNKAFSKDNNTYFVNISDTSVDSIDISASCEDDEASVCIYGNESLESGLNKILINVTAENGNVRTYRIYVTIGE